MVRKLQAVVGAAGLATGIYYTPVAYRIFTLEGEGRSLLVQEGTELAAARAAEQSSAREEATAGALQQRLSIHKQALAEVDADLEEARSRLDALNQARDLALRDAAEASAAIDTAKERAAQLVAAARQHREAAARLHQEAGEAQARSHRERLLLNPLNHPLVKGFSER